jgi:hypothetical protein
MDIRDLAWAAGFFEAEGSVSHHLPKGRKTSRATVDVSQKGAGRPPTVLLQFREVVGGGSIFGPYRGYLYYWRTHEAALISSTISLLWPWLITEKRTQIGATIAAVPALWCAETVGEIWTSHAEGAYGPDEQRAWAAGLFEGDGSIGSYVGRTSRSQRPLLSASISQASADGIPTCLLRFRDIVGIGSIRGPIQPRGWSRLPQYRWQAQGKSVETIMAVLTPWLVGAKREDVHEAISAARAATRDRVT